MAYLGEHLGEAPVLVIPCLQTSPGALGAGNQAGLWGSLLPAAWSYMLAARARGLGTAWTTLHLEYEREVAELLELPDDVYQGVLIPTAYYTGETFRPAPRQPLDRSCTSTAGSGRDSRSMAGDTGRLGAPSVVVAGLLVIGAVAAMLAPGAVWARQLVLDTTGTSRRSPRSPATAGSRTWRSRRSAPSLLIGPT